jgi:hypothetical protein
MKEMLTFLLTLLTTYRVRVREHLAYVHWCGRQLFEHHDLRARNDLVYYSSICSLPQHLGTREYNIMIASLVREQRFFHAWKEAMIGYSSPQAARVLCDHYRRGISAWLELFRMIREVVLQPWEEEHLRRGGQPTTAEEQEVLCARFLVDLWNARYHWPFAETAAYEDQRMRGEGAHQ